MTPRMAAGRSEANARIDGGSERVAKTDFERKAEQLRSQFEDLRGSLDDLIKNYNRLLATGSEMFSQAQRQMARQARENVEQVAETLGEGRFPWWIPVAVIGLIGVGVWLYNTFVMGTTEQPRQHFPHYQAGSQPPATGTESFTEQR